MNQDFRRDKNSPFPPRVSTGRETPADGINTESGTERVAPRGMTRRRRVGITWETEETREVARFVSPPDKSAKLGDDVWGERERERKVVLRLENELGSRRFLLLRSFQIKIVNSKGEFTWIRWMKWKLEKG